MELTRYEPKDIWDPFSDIIDLRQDMGRAFNRFFGRPSTRAAISYWNPPVDIEEEKDNYIVRAELPGVKQKDIHVSLVGNTLTISGERKAEHKEKHEGYHCYERVFGEFRRSFQLPTEVEADKIKAKQKDGILEIDIPKSEKAKPKEISIKVE